MKYLLIDDRANYGWKSILEKAVIKENNALEVASSFSEAINLIDTKYDIIFLDVRLDEEDHYKNDVSEFSGFKLLKKIRESFTCENFSTPIILFTASNKIWYIDAFRENGADSFYVKEHPDTVYSEEFSRKNLELLQQNFLKLIHIGKQRNEIWKFCFRIMNILETHKYFKTQDSKVQNIKQRIIDKLKLGYAQLFSNQTQIEANVLCHDKESLSFLIFWSILEELTKVFTDFNVTWDSKFNRTRNWKFKNKEYFIEFHQKDETYLINFNSRTKIQNVKIKDERYFDGVINLSEQVYSLIYAYSKGQIRISLEEKFRKINRFRNETDYIHSSLLNIFTKKLLSDENKINAFQMNVEILELIITLLELDAN